MMKRKRTNIESILQSTYYSSIIVLFICLFSYFFLNPSNYTKGVAFNPIKSDEPYFNYPGAPLRLLIVFWLLTPLKRELKPSRKKPWIAVFGFISFLFILFANKYRSSVIVSICLMFSIVIFLNFRKGIKWILIPILLAIPFFLILMKLGYFGLGFSEFYVGISGILDNNTTNSIDGSLNYRKIQADTALRYIGKSPLFGIGAVDFQEWRTFSDPAFDNFYVSDLGLLGHIFARGIIGTIIRLFPLFYILRSGFNRFKSFTYQEAICFFMSLGSYIGFSYGGSSHDTFFFIILFMYLSLENYKHQGN